MVPLSRQRSRSGAAFFPAPILLLPFAGCAPPPPAAVEVRAATASPAPTPAPPPFLFDRTDAAGLGAFRWSLPEKRPCNILQTIGNGCAFLDYDNDGNLDILLVAQKPRLFRGDGHGKFVDVSAATGIGTLSGYFLGCAVGDYDNDGFDDLYVSGYREGRLLRNAGGRRFVDVSKTAGIPPQPWGGPATFFDFDGDGRLDLFVGNYVDFTAATRPQLCNYHGIDGACGPGEYAARPSALYRNRGGGRFGAAGFGAAHAPGKTLGVAAAPWREGVPSLAVADDQVDGALLVFEKGRVRDLGVDSGMARAADGRVYGGMGVDWGDYDNDGRPDLAVATYQDQAKWIFRRDGDAFEPQDTARIGMRDSAPYVTFGIKWLDVDNDGWLDLLLANGHVMDNAEKVNGLFPGAAIRSFRQPIVLYRNRGGVRFDDARAALDPEAARPIVGRGLATGDYDNDGQIDALVVDIDGRPVLLHNECPDAGHWLRVALVGQRCSRDGYGATVTATLPDGSRRVRLCQSDGSYLSASDRRLHFGLGSATRATVTVHWPDGATDTLQNVAADATITVREGATSRKKQ